MSLLANTLQRPAMRAAHPAPHTSAPTPCEPSKNDENVPTTDARSASLTPASARSNNAGYMNDIPAANTAVPAIKPTTVGHAAMMPIPTAASRNRPIAIEGWR